MLFQKGDFARTHYEVKNCFHTHFFPFYYTSRSLSLLISSPSSSPLFHLLLYSFSTSLAKVFFSIFLTEPIPVFIRFCSFLFSGWKEANWHTHPVTLSFISTIARSTPSLNLAFFQSHQNLCNTLYFSIAFSSD